MNKLNNVLILAANEEPMKQDHLQPMFDEEQPLVL
jgi:hypothetical protein